LALTEWAAHSGAQYNILLSHFTFVCYDRDKAFSDTDACAHIKTFPQTRYEVGTFYQNREAMYNLLTDAVVYYKDVKTLRRGKIHYSISGHAHRAGAYTFTGPVTSGEIKTAARLYTNPNKRENQRQPAGIPQHDPLAVQFKDAPCTGRP